MVKINIKKFSRSKDISEIVDSDETLDLVEVPAKKRGRPKKEAKVEPQVIQPEPEPEPPTPTPEPEDEPDLDEEEDDGNFLQELNNENFTTPKEESNETALIMKEMFKPPKKGKKQPQLIRDDDSLFGDDATPILGKDKRVLIAKLHQYKNLFPNELKKFKIKTNSGPDQLKACLDEMEAIVETSSIDQFLTDSILQCIKLIETGTSRTKYNISGTAEMLKSNPQFHNLIKQLYVKYNVFSKIPAEFQLVLLVSTTALLCKTKNDKKLELESFLNEPIKKEM